MCVNVGSALFGRESLFFFCALRTDTTGEENPAGLRENKMEITLEDVKGFLKENSDSEDVKEYLSGIVEELSPSKEITVRDLDKNLVLEFLDTKAGKPIVTTLIDRKVSKGIETFKKETMPKLIEAEVEERVAELKKPESEEQKQLKQLKAEIDEMKRKEKKLAMKNSVTGLFDEKKLPLQLVDYFMGTLDIEEDMDEESLSEKLDEFSGLFNETVQSKVDQVFKEHGEPPPKGGKKKDDEEVPAEEFIEEILNQSA